MASRTYSYQLNSAGTVFMTPTQKVTLRRRTNIEWGERGEGRSREGK